MEPKEVLGYEPLYTALMDAFNQSAFGKGKERHADDRPFEDQLICTTTRDVGLGYPKGQAIKKIVESTKLRQLKGIDAEIHELLGAIVYVAAAVVILKEQKTKEAPHA